MHAIVTIGGIALVGLIASGMPAGPALAWVTVVAVACAIALEE